MIKKLRCISPSRNIRRPINRLPARGAPFNQQTMARPGMSPETRSRPAATAARATQTGAPAARHPASSVQTRLYPPERRPARATAGPAADRCHAEYLRRLLMIFFQIQNDITDITIQKLLINLFQTREFSRFTSRLSHSGAGERHKKAGTQAPAFLFMKRYLFTKSSPRAISFFSVSSIPSSACCSNALSVPID